MKNNLNFIALSLILLGNSAALLANENNENDVIQTPGTVQETLACQVPSPNQVPYDPCQAHRDSLNHTRFTQLLPGYHPSLEDFKKCIEQWEQRLEYASKDNFYSYTKTGNDFDKKLVSLNDQIDKAEKMIEAYKQERDEKRFKRCNDQDITNKQRRELYDEESKLTTKINEVSDHHYNLCDEYVETSRMKDAFTHSNKPILQELNKRSEETNHSQSDRERIQAKQRAMLIDKRNNEERTQN